MVPFYRDALRVSSCLESAGSRRPRSSRRRRTNTAPRARAGSVEPDAASRESCAPGPVSRVPTLSRAASLNKSNLKRVLRA